MLRTGLVEEKRTYIVKATLGYSIVRAIKNGGQSCTIPPLCGEMGLVSIYLFKREIECLEKNYIYDEMVVKSPIYLSNKQIECLEQARQKVNVGTRHLGVLSEQ